MKVTRIYADGLGESRFDELDIALRDAGDIGRLSDPIPARSVVFRTNSPEYDFDWHHAPQRQLIVLLDGAIEIEVSSGERRANVRGAFRASRRVAGRHVLLVDDILTTGATLDACAQALRDAGARRVGVLTVARVLHAAV